MKKLIAILSSITMMAVSMLPASAADVSGAVLGDMDANGNIDLMDCAEILRLCAPFAEEPASEEQLAAGDVDGDGIITVNDYALVCQYSALIGASMTVDFGGGYFNWDAEHMLDATRVPMLPMCYSDDIKPMNFFGDVNVDSCINELDAELISEYLESGIIPEKIRIAEADINIDGVIDQKDIDIILAEPTYRISDINNDCYVDLDDVSEVLSHYAEKGASDSVGGIIQKAADDTPYDVNNDGAADLSDAAQIITEYAMTAAGITK